MIVIRSAGTTESERYLANLAEKSFLNLWSYPNLFIDKKQNNKGDGKELCDLLVVCGEHILIFSDKSVAWPTNDDVNVSWNRWYSRAIQKSLQQVRGAERWIRQFPDRIFLDKDCTQRFPIPLRLTDPQTKVHGIIVALGAGAACKEYFGGGIGSLMLRPAIKGDDHLDETSDFHSPFTTGDVDPHRSFIHVFDDATLDIAMNELDTISDFTAYLSKKEDFFRSGNLLGAVGEEELIAYYMTHMNSNGQHDFVNPDGNPFREDECVSFDEGFFSDLLSNPQYIAKKQADQISYIWDRLITNFTDHMLAGTTIVPGGGDFVIAEHEEAVRHMALEPRYRRRVYGNGIYDVFENGENAPRFTRAFLPRPEEIDQETGFFFMTLIVPPFELDGGYEQYREIRRKMLYGYALTFLHKYRNLKRVIGIASEPKPVEGAEIGSSEDLVFVESPEWDDDLLDELRELQDVFDIAKKGRYREYGVQDQEFPEVDLHMRPRDHISSDLPSRSNRHERRAQASKSRRSRKRGR